MIDRCARSRPSRPRRLLAAISLASMTAAVVLTVTFVIDNPMFLIAALLGLASAVVGSWQAVTEQNSQRLIGILLAALGVAVVFAAVLLIRVGDPDVLRLLLIGFTLALGIGSARAALVRDLHEIDRIRARAVPRHPVLICNPKSGGGKVEEFDLARRARELGVEVVELGEDSDLEQLARDAIAAGADCLGMAGGDGSQALVASVAVEADVPFVCISAGTRNHFALDLGLDRADPAKGLEAFVHGVERLVDYASVGHRLFVNNVSLGVYATLVASDDYRDDKLGTALAQLPEMLGQDASPFDLRFTDPTGERIEGAFLIMVSNNPYVLGPSLDVSQRRSLDSGRLGVIAVTAKTGGQAARVLAASTLSLGGLDPNLHEFEVANFQVVSGDQEVQAGVDGESVLLKPPLEFRIHPGGLRILVPRENIMASEKRRARSIGWQALFAIAAGKELAQVADSA